MGCSGFSATEDSFPLGGPMCPISDGLQSANAPQAPVKSLQAASGALTCQHCTKSFTTSGSYGRHVRSRCKVGLQEKNKAGLGDKNFPEETMDIAKAEAKKYPSLKSGLDDLL